MVLFVALPFLGFWVGMGYSWEQGHAIGRNGIPAADPKQHSAPRISGGSTNAPGAVSTTTAIAPRVLQTSECSGSETEDTCWIHRSVHGTGVDLFDVKVPSSWVMRNYSDSSTNNGPWFLQSTPFESNIHGLGIPERGGMWVRIRRTGCDPTYSLHEGEYLPVADEGDKYAPVVEQTVCSGGYEVAAGLWSDDPDSTAHRKVLGEVLAGFSAGAGATL